MPKRFSPTVRPWVYLYLVTRDGEKCAICGKSPKHDNSAVSKNEKVPPKLEIDHIDGNHQNNEPLNLRLACKKCNVTLENRARKTRQNPSDLCESVSVRKTAGRHDLRLNNNYWEEPVTIQMNQRSEPVARAWCIGVISERGSLSMLDAVSGMAEIASCSIPTAQRYLAKLTGPVGRLQVSKDLFGEKIITWKEGENPHGE